MNYNPFYFLCLAYLATILLEFIHSIPRVHRRVIAELFWFLCCDFVFLNALCNLHSAIYTSFTSVVFAIGLCAYFVIATLYWGWILQENVLDNLTNPVTVSP